MDENLLVRKAVEAIALTPEFKQRKDTVALETGLALELNRGAGGLSAPMSHWEAYRRALSVFDPDLAYDALKAVRSAEEHAAALHDGNAEDAAAVERALFESWEAEHAQR